MGKLTIGFQGEHGAYSEEAIFKQFGREVKTVPTVSIHEVFNLTEAGAVDLGVVPVENSVEGSINETYDMLLSSNLKVIGEVVLRVVHCLIALRSAKLEGIKVVYSHPQALAQCRNFVTSLGIEPMVTYDTAGSVKMIKEKRLEGAAAIAGERAARIYGLKVLKKGIEDYSTNSTRFLIVARRGRRDRATEGSRRSRRRRQPREQDFPDLRGPPHPRLAVQRPRGLREGEDQPHQDRVEAYQGAPLGVLLLRGL